MVTKTGDKYAKCVMLKSHFLFNLFARMHTNSNCCDAQPASLDLHIWRCHGAPLPIKIIFYLICGWLIAHNHTTIQPKLPYSGDLVNLWEIAKLKPHQY